MEKIAIFELLQFAHCCVGIASVDDNLLTKADANQVSEHINSATKIGISTVLFII